MFYKLFLGQSFSFILYCTLHDFGNWKQPYYITKGISLLATHPLSSSPLSLFNRYCETHCTHFLPETFSVIFSSWCCLPDLSLYSVLSTTFLSLFLLPSHPLFLYLTEVQYDMVQKTWPPDLLWTMRHSKCDTSRCLKSTCLPPLYCCWRLFYYQSLCLPVRLSDPCILDGPSWLMPPLPVTTQTTCYLTAATWETLKREKMKIFFPCFVGPKCRCKES